MNSQRALGQPAHIKTALEAGCGALITLESVHARAGDGIAEDLRQAIDSLRLAIAELRSASSHGPTVLPGEFVLRTGAPRFAVQAQQR